MLKIQLLVAVLGFALWVFCIVDLVITRDDRVRHLPKLAWLLIVLFFPFVGSLAWLLVGRPGREAPLRREQGAAPGFPEYHRHGRMAAQSPEEDEAFLRQVRARAEEQRRRHEQARREAAEHEQGERPGEPDEAH